MRSCYSSKLHRGADHIWLTLLCAVDEEGADGAEGGELGRVAEPTAGVDGRGRSGVGDEAMRDVVKAGGAEQRGPFVGGE